jgi:DNA repair ATPase RecN
MASRKAEATLTPADRERYGVACAYIQRRHDELGAMRARTDELNTGLVDAVKSCVQVLRHVDEANEQYTKLESAIARFSQLTEKIESLAAETTAAWGKLHEVEQRLLEQPEYAALRPQPDP